MNPRNSIDHETSNDSEITKTDEWVNFFKKNKSKHFCAYIFNKVNFWNFRYTVSKVRKLK